MGIPAGLERTEQAQSALLLPGVGEHSAAVPLHTQQVTSFYLCGRRSNFDLRFAVTYNASSPVPDSLPPGCEFGQADMQKLVPKEEKPGGSSTVTTGFGARKNGHCTFNFVDLKPPSPFPKREVSITPVTCLLFVGY